LKKRKGEIIDGMNKVNNFLVKNKYVGFAVAADEYLENGQGQGMYCGGTLSPDHRIGFLRSLLSIVDFEDHSVKDKNIVREVKEVSNYLKKLKMSVGFAFFERHVLYVGGTINPGKEKIFFGSAASILEFGRHEKTTINMACSDCSKAIRKHKHPS